MSAELLCAAALSGTRLEEFQAILALRHCPGLGAISLVKLLRAFGSAACAVRRNSEWRRHGVKAAGAYESGAWKKAAEKEYENALKSKAGILFWTDAAYPALLREIADGPGLLYFRGDVSLISSPCIAIVGTRNPTEKSRRTAFQFGESLSACGMTVVSGMALGIDREAHLGSLNGPGKSIAVLGTGIDVLYPKSNRDIFERLLAEGLAISEFPPDTAPIGVNFPIRNRIISGISLGVAVMEAATKSGSLITARLASEQNRAVFAVPGDAFNIHSLGCQNLVRQGASPIFGPQDILDDLAPLLKTWKPGLVAITAPKHLAPEQAPLQATEPESPAEILADAAALTQGDASGQILACLLAHGPLHTDLIADRTGLDPGSLYSALLGLEMQGRIRLLPGSCYEAV